MAKMWLNKGIEKTKPTLPSLYYINPNPDGNGICNPNPDRNGIWVGRVGSGIRNQVSGVMFHLRNFFYTFVKNIFLNLPPWNMEQIGQQYSNSLKLQDKIDLKCSRGTGTCWNKMQKGQ
jgi:hypothetical protein